MDCVTFRTQTPHWMEQVLAANDMDCVKFTFNEIINLHIKSQTDSLSKINPFGCLIIVSLLKYFNTIL